MEINSTILVLAALTSGCAGWWLCYALLSRKPKAPPVPSFAEELGKEVEAAERNRLIEEGRRENADFLARYWVARRDRLAEELDALGRSPAPAVAVAEMPDAFRKQLANSNLANHLHAGGGQP